MFPTFIVQPVMKKSKNIFEILVIFPLSEVAEANLTTNYLLGIFLAKNRKYQWYFTKKPKFHRKVKSGKHLCVEEILEHVCVEEIFLKKSLILPNFLGDTIFFPLFFSFLKKLSIFNLYYHFIFNYFSYLSH